MVHVTNLSLLSDHKVYCVNKSKYVDHKIYQLHNTACYQMDTPHWPWQTQCPL